MAKEVGYNFIFRYYLEKAMTKPPYLTTDRIIRPNLMDALTNEYGNNHTLIVEELGLHHGEVRADIAVINGAIHGFEIKSDHDNLLRLNQQVLVYNAVFDYVTLVVGKSHICAALEVVPDWWGITMAKANGDDEVEFFKLREPKKNHDTDNSSVASLLWRDEALSILEELGQDRGVRSKPRQFLYERLAEVLDDEALKGQVRQKLCSRTNWRLDAPLVSCDG